MSRRQAADLSLPTYTSLKTPSVSLATQGETAPMTGARLVVPQSAALVVAPARAVGIAPAEARDEAVAHSPTESATARRPSRSRRSPRARARRPLTVASVKPRWE